MSSRRLLAASTGALAAAAITAGIVGAQAPPPSQEQLPSLTVSVAPNRVTIAGGGAAVASGPTRLVFRNSSRRRDASPSVVRLRSGVTLAELRALLRRNPESPAAFKRLAVFEAGAGIAPRGTYETTIDLVARATYVVANVGANAARAPLTSFTVGTQASEAMAPAPDVTVDLFDYAFAMPEVLPRNGTIRFENRGERLHIAIAFPVRPGRNRAAAVRAFLRNDERTAGRLTDQRRAFEPLGLVSGGTTNDVEVRFPRPGNWVFVCFIEDGEPGDPPHNTLGMVKAFRVGGTGAG
jgi:hypothetical protein